MTHLTYLKDGFEPASQPGSPRVRVGLG